MTLSLREKVDLHRMHMKRCCNIHTDIGVQHHLIRILIQHRHKTLVLAFFIAEQREAPDPLLYLSLATSRVAISSSIHHK